MSHIRGFISRLSKTTSVPRTTLLDWRRQLNLSLTWSPWNTEYGKHLRVFSDEEGLALRVFILANFINPGLFLTDSDFRLLVMQFYSETHPDHNPRGFGCWNGYIYHFKRQRGLASRKNHYKRRSTVDPEARAEFAQRMECLIETMDGDRIVNCDEKNWLLWPNGLLTWAERRQKPVQIKIDGDNKASFTVMATITASGCKLPLQILAKGLTERVHTTHTGDISGVWRDYTESG
jgi:hypothetical protein